MSLESAFIHNMCAPRKGKKKYLQTEPFDLWNKGKRMQGACVWKSFCHTGETNTPVLGASNCIVLGDPGVSFHGSQDINSVCFQTCSLNKIPIHTAQKCLRTSCQKSPLTGLCSSSSKVSEASAGMDKMDRVWGLWTRKSNKDGTKKYSLLSSYFYHAFCVWHK